MKKIILILILFPFYSFAQNEAIMVKYQAIYNTELPTTKTGYLYIDKNGKQSVYFTESNNIEKNKDDKPDDADIVIKLGSGIKRFNYFDKSKNQLVTRDDIFRDSYLILEDIPNIEWQLTDEIKEIEGVVVNKATCYFRGRNYVAWYSTSIPIKSGPWKFQGLPGLIFEVYDDTRRYNWILEKVTNSSYDFSSVALEIDEQEKISIKEYAQLKFGEKNAINKQISSKLPRGTSIISQKSFRTGFEIKFEWEKETEKE